MTEHRYDAFDNLLYLSMRYFNKHGSPPRKVKLPLDEAEMLVKCRHAGIPNGISRSVTALEIHGVAGMAVEIDHDPDAQIELL